MKKIDLSSHFLIRLASYLLVTLVILTNCIEAQNSENQPLEWSKKMASSVMSRRPLIAPNDWTYTTGTVLRAFEELWVRTGDSTYFNYIKTNIDDCVRSDGSIRDYNMYDYNIDMIKNGSILLFLYNKTGEEKYKNAADILRQQLEDHPRTSDGGFWHKERYTDQMWLDGLYMGTPFYAHYAGMFNEPESFDDVAKQFLLIEEHCKDPETGLYYHGWEEVNDTSGLSPGRHQEWSDPETGHSPAFWGRAIGWFSMALVDVLDYLPQDHENRDDIIRILRNLSAAMADFQDEETGVWWQVVDQGNREGNYLESSVSTMMLYTVAKGIRKGYLDEDQFRPMVEKAYNGILEQFIEENDDSTLDLTQTCRTAGLGNGRPGTFEYYVYGESIVTNDPKALGPFINGYLEMYLLNSLEIPTGLNAVPVSGSEVELSWNDNSNQEEGYKIEQADSGSYIQIAKVDSNVVNYTVSDLTPLTEYKFRVRSFKGDTNSIYSNVATVMTLGENGTPSLAVNPSPANEAISVDTVGTELSWKSGAAADSHAVYFGTSNPPSFVQNQTENTYSPGKLNEETTYYWKINEINTKGETEGKVWSFTTEVGPLPKIMTAHWPFDESAGNTASDASEYNNTGTLHNMSDASWTSGVLDGGLEFDGEDDYILVPHSDYIDFSDNSFSISFWLKQNVENRHMRYLIKGTHEAPGTGKRYEVFHHADNEIRFAIDDNFNKTSLALPNTDFVTGDWVHVVAIRDTDAGQIYLYLNGEQVGSLTDVTGDISQKEDMYIGVSSDEDNTNLAATLDDIRLYSYALSQSEIQDLYNEVGVATIDIPKKYTLAVSSYPNPFNPHTEIKYTLPHKSEVNLTVYNLLGEEVRCLVQELQDKGEHSYDFQAENLSSGVYICKLQVRNKVRTTKMLLLK